MISTTKPKPKLVKRFRVRLKGGKYCQLNYDFAELGVLIPHSGPPETAHEFATLNGAHHAMSRTIEAQRNAQSSMFRDWKSFDPLRFKPNFEVVEHQIEDPDQ